MVIRLINAVFIALFMLAVSFPSTTLANERLYRSQDITILSDNNASRFCSAGSTTVLTGDDNPSIIMNALMSQGGYTALHAASVVGNLMKESFGRIDPEARNPSSGAYGISQWLGARRADLFARFNTNSPSFEQQLEFLLLEVNHETGKNDAWLTDGLSINVNGNPVPGRDGWLQTDTVESATIAFRRGFVRPGEAEADDATRIDYAIGVLEASGIDPNSFSNGSGSTGCIQPSGTFIDGFTFYNQADPQWAAHPYGTSTLARSGCGPAAVAMAITALTGRDDVTPVEVADWGTANGAYEPGAGSKHQEMFIEAPRNWNLNTQVITRDEVNDVLSDDGLVILSGKGALPYTSGGHIILLRAITAEGKYLIADSGHFGQGTNEQEFDPDQIFNGTQSTIVAITRGGFGGQ